MGNTAYDPNGELIGRADRVLGQAAYQYDPAGRMRSAQHRLGKEGFEWDPASNLLNTQGNVQGGAQAWMLPAAVTNNRVTVYQDKRYRYDTHGRLVEKRIGAHTVQRFQYNSEHQLIECVTLRHGRAESVRFDYDALGRRIAKHSPRGTTRFGWDGMQMIEEHGQNGHTLTLYEPHSYTPLARIDQGPLAANDEATTYWYHTTPTGLPEELTDAQGRLVWQARYQCWGNLALESYPEHAPNTDPTRITQLDANLRNPGQYHDRETGLFYNTFRYYDPDIGRFTTEDPIGLAGGSNLYQYGPNPISWIDPWGWAVTPLNAPGYSTYGMY